MDPMVVAMAGAFAPFSTYEVAAVAGSSRRRVDYATGLVVSPSGHIVTARQAVDGCRVIVIPRLGNAEQVAATDRRRAGADPGLRGTDARADQLSRRGLAGRRRHACRHRGAGGAGRRRGGDHGYGEGWNSSPRLRLSARSAARCPASPAPPPSMVSARIARSRAVVAPQVPRRVALAPAARLECPASRDRAGLQAIREAFPRKPNGFGPLASGSHSICSARQGRGGAGDLRAAVSPCYLFLNFAGRFSMKAAMPSFRSSVVNNGWNTRRSKRTPSASDVSNARLMLSLAA